MADLYYIESGYFTPDGYYVYTADADALVAGTLTVSAVIGVIKPFSIDITATGTVTAVISHIEGADLQAFSDAALTTTPNVIRNLDSAISASVSQSSTEERIRNVDSVISAAVSLSSIVERIRSFDSAITSTFSISAESGSAEQGQADLSATSSLSVDAVANRSASITQDTIVTLSSQNDRIRYADSSLSILSSVTTDIVKTVEANSTISSSSTQTTNIERIQQGNISVTALFTPTLDAVVTVNSFAVLESNASLTVQAQKQTDIVSNQSSTLTLSGSVAATKDYLSNLSSTASLTAAVVKSVEVSINVTSAFAPSLSVTVFKNQVAVLSSEFTSSISARKTARAQIAANVIVNLTAGVNETSSANVSLNSQFTTTSIIGSRKQFAVTLPVYAGIYCRLDERYFRPLQFQSKTVSASINTDNPKFGSGYADNGSGNIKWYAHSSLMPTASNESLQIQYWQRNIPSSTSSAAAIQFQDNIGVLWEIRTYYIGPTSSRGVSFRYRTSSGASPTYQSVVGQYTFTAPNDWNYIAFRKNNGSGGALWINGTRVFYNAGFDISWQNQNTPGTLIIGQTEPTYAYIAVDEVKISKPFYLTGLNPESTTIPVPTEPFTNDIDTVALFHFNGDFTDDISQVETAQATITSSASVSALINYISRNNSANITANSSLVCLGGKLELGNISAQSEATLSSTASRTKQFTSNIQTTSSISVLPYVTRTYQSSINSNFSQSTINSRTRAVGIQTDSIATQLSAVAKIGDFLIAFDANITSVVSAVKTTDIVSNQTAQSTLSTDADLIANGATSISSSSNVSASFDRTRDHTVDIGATVSQTTLPVKTTDSTITLNSQFNQLVETSGIIGGQANLQSIASINCVITRNRFADSTLAVTTSVQTDAIVVLQASASFSAESNTSIDNSRTRAVGIQTDSIATQLTAVALTGQGFITLDAPVTLTTVAIKTAVSSSDLNSSSNVYCLFGIIKPAAGSLTSTTSLSGDGVVGIVGESYNQTTVTLDCVAVKTTEVSSTNSIITSVSALAVRTRRVGIQLFASGGQLIEGRRIKFAQANLVTTSTMTCLGGVNLVILNQTLFNTATVTAQVRSIHIDPYLTWIVDEESRSYKINQETRLRKIAEETRTHIIEGA